MRFQLAYQCFHTLKFPFPYFEEIFPTGFAIVSDEHLLASAKPDQVYYDSQRKCGCFWSGVLDNEDELRSLWSQYRPQSTGNSAKMLAQLYEILSEKLFEKLDGCFVIVFVQGHQLQVLEKISFSSSKIAIFVEVDPGLMVKI